MRLAKGRAQEKAACFGREDRLAVAREERLIGDGGRSPVDRKSRRAARTPPCATGGSTKRKRRELRLRPRLILKLGAYLPHPEQDAQQSAEGQHAALAAFTALVRPNATTAINRIALMAFMTFSFLG